MNEDRENRFRNWNREDAEPDRGHSGPDHGSQEGSRNFYGPDRESDNASRHSDEPDRKSQEAGGKSEQADRQSQKLDCGSQNGSLDSRGPGHGSAKRSRKPQGDSRDSQQPSCEEMSRLYSAREMAEQETSAFEAHLTECSRCRELVAEWGRLFSILSSGARFEAPLDFDSPVMAFVEGLIRRREHAEAVRRRSAWAVGVALATAIVVLSAALRSFVTLPPQGGSRLVMATTWIVDAFGRGIDWLIFSLMNTVKIGEALVQVSEKFNPVWDSIRLAAGHVDARLIVLEILLFMLSLMLFREFLGAAQKGRSTNVGIII